MKRFLQQRFAELDTMLTEQFDSREELPTPEGAKQALRFTWGFTGEDTHITPLERFLISLPKHGFIDQVQILHEVKHRIEEKQLPTTLYLYLF